MKIYNYLNKNISYKWIHKVIKKLLINGFKKDKNIIKRNKINKLLTAIK
jgi:hypothetical protein